MGMWIELHEKLNQAKQELNIFLTNSKIGHVDVDRLVELATMVKELESEYGKRDVFRFMTIERDDDMYPISADNFAELRELREDYNRCFISHGYGSIARSWDGKSSCYRYYDIYKEIETDWKGNLLDK